MPYDNPFLSLLAMVIVIAAVIAMAYWFTRHIVGGKTFQSFNMLQKNEQLRVLAQTQIGKEQRLVVVRAGRRYFLLGAAPQSVSLLAELTEEEAAVWLQGPQSEEKKDFGQAFLEALRQRKKG